MPKLSTKPKWRSKVAKPKDHAGTGSGNGFLWMREPYSESYWHVVYPVAMQVAKVRKPARA